MSPILSSNWSKNKTLGIAIKVNIAPFFEKYSKHSKNIYFLFLYLIKKRICPKFKKTRI